MSHVSRLSVGPLARKQAAGIRRLLYDTVCVVDYSYRYVYSSRYRRIRSSQNLYQRETRCDGSYCITQISSIFPKQTNKQTIDLPSSNNTTTVESQFRVSIWLAPPSRPPNPFPNPRATRDGVKAIGLTRRAFLQAVLPEKTRRRPFLVQA